jgi:hypothetical protein
MDRQGCAVTLSIGALALGALAGAGLGAIHLGLLWLAVRRLPQDRGGVLVFVGLGLARLTLLLCALAATATLGLPVEGIAAAVSGFVAMRFATTRLLGQEPPRGAIWK